MKKLLYILLLIAGSANAQVNQGADGKMHTSSPGANTVTTNQEIQGGYYGTVADTNARNALPAYLKFAGTTRVTVLTDTTDYIWSGTKWFKTKSGSTYIGSQGIIINGSSVKSDTSFNVTKTNRNTTIGTATQSAINLRVPKTTTLTINGTTQDLSANRTFTVPTTDTTSLSNRINKKVNNTDTIKYLKTYNNLADLPNITAARSTLQVSGRLRSLISKIVQNNAGSTATVNFMPLGDSISGDIFSQYWVNAIKQAYGPYTSQHGGGAQVGAGGTLVGTASLIGQLLIMNSLTSSGTTATAHTASGNGLANGQTVVISGASNSTYNGTFVISNVTTNSFDYTIPTTATSPDPASNIYYALSPDYSKWITGQYINIPSGGSYYWAKAGSDAGYSVGFTKIKIFYLSEVGGGTFKVQTSLDGTTYTDVVGYTSVSANDTQNNLQILTIPNPSSPTPVWIKVVYLSGQSTKIVGMGYENTSGSKYTTFMGVGGIALKDMATCPERIWAAYLKDFQPDIITECLADDVDASYIAALSTTQGYFSKYAPQAAVIYSTVYNAQISDPGYLPATASYKLAATQNAAIRAFLAADTNPTEKYIFDANAYMGSWTTSSAMGLHDASVPVTISGLSISGSTITITTATPHLIGSQYHVRIIGASPAEYNGLYLNSGVTVTGANTLTVTLPSGATAPTLTGSGGNVAAVDGIHAGETGRALLGMAFIRDFPVLTGYQSSYPFKIGSAPLVKENVAFTTGGTLTGDYVNTSTTDVSGASVPTATDATGSFRTAGGIWAAKNIKAAGVTIGTTAVSSANLLQIVGNVTNTNYTGLNQSITQNVNTTGAYPLSGGGILTTVNMSGTANNTAFPLNGLFSQINQSGSGTGSTTALNALYGSAQISNSGTTGALTGVHSYVSSSAGSTATASYGYYAEANLLGSGNAYGYYIANSYAGKAGFYNSSNAYNYMGTGNTGFGITTPLATLHLRGQNATPGVAPIRIDYPVITTAGTSGTGTVATINFATLPYIPFSVGTVVTISGISPAGYNGTYTLTSCSNSSLSYSNATTGSQTTAGTIQTGLKSTPVAGELERDATQFYLTANDGTRRAFVDDSTPQAASNKTLISPNLNTTSTVGQVWTASNTTGGGSWSNIPVRAGVVSAAGTLTLAYSQDYVFSGTTATWTLPAISGALIFGNTSIVIKNRGSGNIILNSASGSNDIFDTSAVSTLTISPGSSIVLTNDGTYFNKR